MGKRDVEAVLADLNSPPWNYQDGSKYTDYDAVKNYAAGMDLGAVKNASGALATVGKLYDGSLQSLQTAAQILGEAWQGGGADDALANLQQLFVATGTMKNTHTNLGTLLSQHVEMMQPFQDFFTKNLEDAEIGPPSSSFPATVGAGMKNDFTQADTYHVPQGTIAAANPIQTELENQYKAAMHTPYINMADQDTIDGMALTKARLQNAQNSIGVASQSVVDSFVAFPQKVSITLPAPNVVAPNPVVDPGNKKVPGPPGMSAYPTPRVPAGPALPKNGFTPGSNTPGANVPAPGTNPLHLPPGVTDPSHLSSNPPGTTPPGTTPPGTTPPGLTPPGTTPPGTTPPGTTPPVLTPPGSIPPPSSTNPKFNTKIPNAKLPAFKAGDTGLLTPTGTNPKLGPNAVGDVGAQGGNPSAAQAGTLAEDAALGRTAAMAAGGMGNGMMPMMPMGGMGGQGGQEHERMAWMMEEDEAWEADQGGPPVIG